MKAISTIKEKLKINILSKIFGGMSGFSFIVQFLLTILFVALTCWMLVSSFVLHKDTRIKAALEAGQRLEVSLTTGEITGKISKTNTEDTEGKEPAENAVASKDKPKDKADINKPEATEAAKEFAWVNEDFIGPKLPKEVLEEFLSKDLTSPKITIERVSIKDISEKPVVVIIIKGIGLSSSSTREALDLPKEVTMGISPYSPSLDFWVKKIKEEGHEVVLNIPMESEDYRKDDPGVYSLITQATAEDNITRLKMLLAMTEKYNAVYSDNSEVFTRSATSITPILEVLKKKNKYFVYGGGYSNYSMIQMAEGINYPILVNDLVLDDEISSSAINEKFKEIEKIAAEKGYVVVMAHPYPMTIRMLQAWIATTKEKGLVVSPVSLLLGKVLK